MINRRTSENLRAVYWADGAYIPEVLDEVNWLLRDWRREKTITIDHRTLDIIATMHRKLEARTPFEVVSGYRTAATNAMLRARSKGVAKHSYHIKGMAVDLRMKSRSTNQIWRAAMSIKGGGVGKYTHSAFVHVDCGPVRHWGS